MARATDIAVKELIPHWPNERDLKPFIDLASALVDKAYPSGESEVVLTLIENNLAAHYATEAIQPRIQGQSDRDGSRSFLYRGMGLRSTPWGQAALDLDPQGKLAAITLRKKQVAIQASSNSPLDVEVD